MLSPKRRVGQRNGSGAVSGGGSSRCRGREVSAESSRYSQGTVCVAWLPWRWGRWERGHGLHPVMQANLVSFRDLDFILGELGPHGRI